MASPAGSISSEPPKSASAAALGSFPPDSPKSSQTNLRKRRITKPRVPEFEQVENVTEPTSPSVSVEILPTQQDESSARALKQRVPWSKSGWYHRCVQLTHVLNMSNVLLFPAQCSKHGGGAFLVAYVISYLFVGIPLLCVEMALGQFSSVPPIELFRKMSPSLSGIGVSMLAILMFRVVYFSAIAAQAFYSAIITILGLTSGQHWTGCDFEGASKLCFKHEYQNCSRLVSSNGSASINFEEFNSACRGWIDGMDQIYQHQWRFWRPPHMEYMMAKVFRPIFSSDDWALSHWLVLVLLVMWIIKSFLTYIGVRKLGTLFLVLKFIIVGAMFVNTILSVIFDTKSKWIDFFNSADFAHLGAFEVWADAIVHVLASLNVGTGAVHKISSLSHFHENFLFNSLIVSAVDMLFSFTIGIGFFSALGSVAQRIYPSDKSHMRIKFLLTHGFVVSHTMFPEHMMWSLGGVIGTMLAAFHYIKISVLLVPGVIVNLGIIRSAAEELLTTYFPRVLKHELLYRRLLVTIMGIVGFFSATIFVGPGGFMLNQLWHEFCGTAVILICIAEVIAISYHYGFRRYLANVQTMLQRDSKAHLLYTFSAFWYYFITPALLFVTMVFKIFWNQRTAVLDYLYPHEFEASGWVIVIFITIIIFSPIVRYLYISLRMRSAAHLFEPMMDWGPIKRKDYESNLRNERAASVRLNV